MKEIKICTTFLAYNSFNDLPIDIQNLMNQAKEVRKNAYAPYSRFRVGVAILLDNEKVVLGSNQENAAEGRFTGGPRRIKGSTSLPPGKPLATHCPRDSKPPIAKKTSS